MPTIGNVSNCFFVFYQNKKQGIFERKEKKHVQEKV